tara:strand:+ start:42 stop:548 length:507 start_codon:yes stop_codon:yes gene_type:complete
MIEYNIDQSIINYANKKLEKITINNTLKKNKFGSEKKRILEGYIGEKIIMDFLNIKKDDDEFDYDLLSNKGKKLEIKTISCKFKPLEEYLCTVNSYKTNGVHKQDADYYIFLRILNDYSKGWILGWVSCDSFFKKGKFIPKGNDFGKFKFIKANATVLSINKLNKFKI